MQYVCYRFGWHGGVPMVAERKVSQQSEWRRVTPKKNVFHVSRRIIARVSMEKLLTQIPHITIRTGVHSPSHSQKGCPKQTQTNACDDTKKNRVANNTLNIHSFAPPRADERRRQPTTTATTECSPQQSHQQKVSADVCMRFGHRKCTIQ